MKKRVLILCLLVASTTLKGQINANFKLYDVVSESSIFVDGTNSKGVVIFLMSNKCPFTLYYINRMQRLEKLYKSQGIQFNYVNSFLKNDESIAKMKIFGAKHHLNNYLADKDQLLKNKLTARKTPEVFLLKKTGSKLTHFYAGPIDNNPQVESAVEFYYLKDNIDNLLAGKSSINSNTLVMGCVIK